MINAINEITDLIIYDKIEHNENETDKNTFIKDVYLSKNSYDTRSYVAIPKQTKQIIFY